MQSRVRKNTFFVSIGQITKMALALVLFPIGARYLGPGGFNNYLLASTIMYFLFLFNDLGMNTYLTREISKDLSKTNDFYINALITKLAVIFVDFIILAVFLAALNFSTEANIAILIFAVYGISTSLFELNASVFRAHERMEFETIFTVLEKVITTVAGIYVLIKGWGLFAFCAVFTAGGFISIIISTLYAKKYFVKSKLSFDYSFARKMVRNSLPFGISLTLAYVYNSVGIILISKIQPENVAGWFSTPARMLHFTSIIPMILSIAIFPALSREMVYAKDKFSQLYTKGFKYISYIAIPLTTGIFMLADKIALNIFGAEYIGSPIVLRIIAVAAGLLYFNIFLAAVFNAANKQKLLVVIQLSALTLNIVLNLFLIPQFAHQGAAIVMTITESFIFLICVSYAMIKIARLQEYLFIIKALLASLCMGIILFAFHEVNLFLMVFSGAAIYFLILYLFKGFTIQEIFEFKKGHVESRK
jgi:O-antigen/teichoic acid export membrane protein